MWGTEVSFTRDFILLFLEKIKKRQEEVESLLTAEVKTTDGGGEDEEAKAEEPGVGEEVVQMDQGGGRRGEQANSDSGEGSD